VATTAVFFARMSTADVAWYVESGEGRDKAGAYAIQGLAARFVERIEGSYSNVVGLPVAVVQTLLEELNVA
jgi:septum formation protein